MNIFESDNIKSGKGIPAICIPIMGNDKEQLRQEIGSLKGKPYQLVEWRADYMMAAMNGSPFWTVTREVLDTLGFIKSILDKPVLFTIRTDREGGEICISEEDYFFINRMVADSGMADLIDVEGFTANGTDMVSEFVKYAHNADQKVILSNHDFEKTPTVDEMTQKYADMIAMGGDIVKLAVMPETEDDVAALLEAAAITNEQNPEKPLVAISMGELGMSSRICAGQFGSVMTFASGKAASAPGQIDAVTLQEHLEKYYK